MGHVTRELIDNLIADLKAADAWDSEEKIQGRKKIAGKLRDELKEKPIIHGMVLHKQNAGLKKVPLR